MFRIPEITGLGETSTGTVSTTDAQGFKTEIGGFFGDLLNLGTKGFEKYLEFQTVQAQLDNADKPDTSKTPNSQPVFAQVPPIVTFSLIGLLAIAGVSLITRKGGK